MGQYANFYNSKNGDRTYDADSFSEVLKPLFKDGVINGELQVKAYSNMMIKVEPGNVFIGGKHKFFEQPTNLTIESANPTLDRIDNIVIRRNDTERDFTLMVVKGSNSQTPQAPIPTRGGGIYDLVIAQVYVNRATIRIEQSHITDTRMNSQLCGWVSGAVEQIAFEQITAQFLDFYNTFKNSKTQEFNAWFGNIQSTLNSNAVANLSQQLHQLSSVVSVNNDNRKPIVLRNHILLSGYSWSNVSKQPWDSNSEYLFRQKVNVGGMTTSDKIIDYIIPTEFEEKLGMIETTTNGFYVYAKERINSTINIIEICYLKG